MSSPLRGAEKKKMQTINLEYTAEDLISHKLQRNGILIAKPKFDINGADLIAFINFEDSVKIGRIQSKGRTLFPGQRQAAKITIPKKYVHDAFFLFIYFDIGIDNTELYLFNVKQIKETWKKNTKEEYYLSIRHNQLNKINPYLFNEQRIEEIKQCILKSKSKVESLLLDIVKTQKSQMVKIKELNHLNQIVLEYKISKIEVEKYSLEIEKYQKELLAFIKEKAEILPKTLVKEIKNSKSKINNVLKEKCFKYIEKELIDDVVKYIIEET